MENHAATAPLVRVLFFSRGRGRGHAIPDIYIARELGRIAPFTRIDLVSYGKGACTFRSHRLPVIDMLENDDPDPLSMVAKCTRLILETRPDMVVAHEEFSALVAAHSLATPCIVITDFFTDPDNIWMRWLRRAAEIVFTGDEGVFPEPLGCRDRISYVGRAVRPFQYRRSDRLKARMELKIPAGAAVVLFQPGSWTEARLPAGEMMVAGWKRLAHPLKKLLWLAGDDHDEIARRYRADEDIVVMRQDWSMDRLLAASDVVVTKANRISIFEAAALGVPSISLSAHKNWADDAAISRVKSNRALELAATTTGEFSRCLAGSMKTKPRPELRKSHGIAGAAQRIALHARRYYTLKTLDALAEGS